MDYEVIIIGAGVVGLAIAAKLSKNRSCLVLEKNCSFGEETSSRNSEVIHGGMYYPTDSLKAKLCVEGKHRIYNWCEDRNIDYSKCGKLIIAIEQEDLGNMHRILKQGVDNNVKGLKNIRVEEAKEIEPNVKCTGALYSEYSGIVDSHKLMQSYEDEAKRNNADFAYNHKVINISKVNNEYQIEVKTSNNEIFSVSSKFIINCGGLYADKIAEMIGIDINKNKYELILAKGNYFRLAPSKKNLLNRLIYPAVKKDFTHLGIHATVELDGSIKFGPDIHFLQKKIQDYSVDESLREIFYNSISKYIDGIEIDDISPDYSGIRAKLQIYDDRFRDFIIRNEKDNGFDNFINLIGIESPGLTCSLEIAELVNKIM